VKKEKEEEFWNYMRLLCNVGQQPICDKNVLRVGFCIVRLSDSQHYIIT
jgi:hypothetical protein